MDSHSRSASPRDSARPQHRPPSPPSPVAFDNRAYTHDDADPNHNDSFSSSPPQNGKEPNGDTKTLEAVNLELINLTPKNGNGKQKKDVEVDMNATNPYDEYFVPVNEHRKYMRGEKLYVTADKRGEKGGCKRPLCWTLLGLVVAAIVALIVLAATGVLFTNSPTTLEQYNTSISSARAFGGVGSLEDEHDHSGHDHSGHDHSGHDHSGHDHSGHDHSGHDHSGHDHSGHDHSEFGRSGQDHSEQENTESTQSPETQNDEGLEHAVVQEASEEVGDSSMYVPRTVEGELKIDNEDFKPEFDDPESPEYRQFAADFSGAMKRALFDRSTLEGDQNIYVEVLDIRKGSLIVTYRIHWKPKTNAEPNEDLLTAKSLQTTLKDYLSRNSRMISTYHVAEDAMSTRAVLDVCKISKNDCQYECQFDERTLDFVCICPRGQMLDMMNPKKCMSIFENSEHPDDITKQKEFRVLTVDSNPTTNKPISEEEKPNTSFVHVSNEDHIFDWTDTRSAQPSTTTESDLDLKRSHVFGYANEKPDESHPSKSAQENESQESNSAPEPSPEPEPTAEPTAEPEPEPAAEPTPAAEPAPAAEPEPTATPEPAAEPEPEPAAQPASEPAAQPEPTEEPEPEPASEPEPSAEPNPKPEPNAEPEPIEEPNNEAAKTTVDLKSNPEAEPAAEPTPEPEPSADANSEPTPEPKPSDGPEPTAEPKLHDEEELAPDHKVMEGIETTSLSSEVDSKKSINEDSDEHGSLEINPSSYHNHFYSDAETTTAEPIDEPTTDSDWLENSKDKPVESYNITQQRSLESNHDIEVTTSQNKAEGSMFEHLNEILSNEAHTTTTQSNEDPLTTEMATDTTAMEENPLILSTQVKNEKDINSFIGNASSLGKEPNVPVMETTTAPETTTDYSLNKQLKTTPEEDKELVNALHIENKLEKIESATERLQKDDDTLPITFDDINTHFNRASKSIDKENTTTEFMPEPTSNVIHESPTTTESEWLSEKVSEEPYEGTMNQMEKHETTETSESKLNELTNSNSDSEPDYSGIGTTSRSPDSDVPLYGMTHDYDDVELPEKIRVNKNVQESTNIKSSEVSIEMNKKTVEPETTPEIDVETTTISEYIYKAFSETNKMLDEPSTSENTTNVVISNPAPVWEEPEGTKDLAVKELPDNKDSTATDISVVTESTQTSPVDTISQDTDNKDTENQSSTTANNLKVTIYEISSHNSNNSINTHKTNTHSAETESEHELDMNPFLPDLENPGLHEHHDPELDSASLNETQNEHTQVEEQSLHRSDTHESTSNEGVTVMTEAAKKDIKITTQSSSAMSDDSNTQSPALVTPQSPVVDTKTTIIDITSDNVISTEKSEPETSPISTFLQDTDDLEINKHNPVDINTESVTTLKPLHTSGGMATESNNMLTDDTLSVLPVGGKPVFESDNSEKLNDISDSPKERTVKTNESLHKLNVNDVFNNEA